MRLRTFSLRCAKEILRDPLTLGFGLGFPLVLILLLSAIQANIPAELFALEQLTPGITVFGLSFLTLFSATLISRDRETALLQRLYTTPLTVAAIQSALCYLLAMALGLAPTVNMLWAIISIVPVSLFFIALGLLCGSILTVKQTGGVCGALLTNLSAWLSGVWFELDLVGGAFRKIAYALPFVHAVEVERAVFRGDWPAVWPHALWVLGYTVLALAGAILLFLRQMKRQ